MKQLFGFMDETGVLSSDPKQRFFALGLLKIEKTSLLFEQIKNLKDRYKLNGKFEFKFSNIKRNGDLPLHKELVDICFNYPDFFFASIVLDKHLLPNMQSSSTTWDAQLDLAKQHIKSSIKEDEQVAIMADYLTKPRRSNRYFETELLRLRKVFNACMIESDSSAFVQVVDILIGSVVYRHKIEHGLANETTPKGQLVVYIESKLKDAFSKHNSSSGNFRHQQNLLSTFTIFEPFYFSVYQKRTGS